MSGSLPLSIQIRIKLAGLALAGAGFWLVPEDPALPALLLTAIALPLTLIFWLSFLIIERRDIARARARGAARGPNAK